MIKPLKEHYTIQDIEYLEESGINMEAEITRIFAEEIAREFEKLKPKNIYEYVGETAMIQSPEEINTLIKNYLIEQNKNKE